MTEADVEYESRLTWGFRLRIKILMIKRKRAQSGGLQSRCRFEQGLMQSLLWLIVLLHEASCKHGLFFRAALAY